MKRPLKFRQPIFNSEGMFLRWHIWGWISEDNFTGPMSMSSRVDGEFGQQFTGVVDKNGTEIYEGDVISRPNTKPNKVFVRWCDNTSEFAIPNRDFVARCCEIIGNIYENPELMEGAEK